MPKIKGIKVEDVLKQASAHKVIKLYLPDIEDLRTGLYIDRDFLFSTVHTLEPTYFRRLLKEYYQDHKDK